MYVKTVSSCMEQFAQLQVKKIHTAFEGLSYFSLQVATHAEQFNEAVETAKGHLKSKVN